MIKLTVHEETRGQWKKRPNPEQPTHNHDSAANRQHPAHLHWCGADPPSSWPAHAAGRRGDPPKRGYIFVIFAGFFLGGHRYQPLHRFILREVVARRRSKCTNSDHRLTPMTHVDKFSPSGRHLRYFCHTCSPIHRTLPLRSLDD